ncbi:MAG: hypothetical protein ACFFKA_15195, partial [Candidatus Thorarchaeota archaeon]
EKLLKFKFKVKIEHFFDLPVGCGYGASGSGALGTIFGLNRLLNLKMSKLKCGELAHIAEIVNKTGLGTVCGQIGGGLCILTEPGYPCKTKQVYVPQDVIIISASFGKIPTKSILSDVNISNRIKDAGRIAIDKIMLNPDYKNFIKCSIEFVKQSKIIESLQLGELEILIKDLNNLEVIGASMNQLGRSVYVFCKHDKKKLVNEVLTSYNASIKKYDLKVYRGDSIIFGKI